MEYFFGVYFLVGGAAMARCRRGFIALLREMAETTQTRSWPFVPGDSYYRGMEWFSLALGVLFAVIGVLLLAGVIDFSEPS